MAFQVVLATNNSEPNRMMKDVTDILTVTGTLKADTSIIDPVILIECDLTQVRNVNYMRITAFNRRYFVTNIRSMRNGLVEFSCHVDVLSTYANEILQNKGIVRKQENDWNLYLNDGTLRTYQYSKVVTKKFPNGFPVGVDLVMAIAGPSNLGS